MSTDTHHPTPSGEESPRSHAPQLPAWTRPAVRTSEIVNPYFIVAGAILLVFMLAMLFVGKTNFDWLFNLLAWFSFAFGVGFIALLIARHEAAVPGWVGAGIGLLLYFGFSFLLPILASKGGVKTDDKFYESLMSATQNMGQFLLIISILQLVIKYTLQVLYQRNQTQTRSFKYLDSSNKDTQKPSMVPRCWQMSRCRPAVRQTCPNYIDRVNCWKRRSGCFCDKELANYLVNSVDHSGASEVIEFQSAAGPKGLVDIRARMKNAKIRPWKLQKALCFNCPVFIEHQEYKYKHLGWTAFPVTIGIVVALFSLFDTAYKAGARSLENFLVSFVQNHGAFLPENFHVSATGLEDSMFEYVLLGVLSLLLAGYVIAFSETVFMKWKL
ncbi:MAG: hypothetical protein ACYDBB_18425 [Armatimonadota bacterium]